MLVEAWKHFHTLAQQRCTLVVGVKFHARVDKPIVMPTSNLNVLGATPKGANIIQRCMLVSQIKPKQYYKLLIQIVIFVYF